MARRGQFTPEDARVFGAIGGLKNITVNGRRQAAAHLGPALASKRRDEAIRLGARTPEEIAERMQDLARLQGKRAAAARWGGRSLDPEPA